MSAGPMIDGVGSGRTDALKGCLLLAWALAIVPNTIEAFGGPEGDWWQALRAGLSALFALAFVAFAASWLADRRGR
jgi:hypothetical protein